jgi:ABC-2 type transport system permease protein
MGRYLRLYGHFLRFSFAKALQWRVDFFFRVVMDCLFYAVNLVFFSVLYRHTPSLGGWTEDQAFVFIAGVFLVDALHMTVFSNNMWWFPFLVNRGDLDYYLVRPVSSLFFVSLREFAANSFLNLLIASGILAWALLRYPAALGAGEVVVYLALLVVGTFLYYVLHLSFLIPVFWLHGGSGLRELYFSLERFYGRPHEVYRGILRGVLLTVLPFALVASVPATALFGGLSWHLVLHVAGIAALAFLGMTWLWRRGLRAYASASS